MPFLTPRFPPVKNSKDKVDGRETLYITSNGKFHDKEFGLKMVYSLFCIVFLLFK